MEHSNPTQNPCDHGRTGTGNGDDARTYERFQILKIFLENIAQKCGNKNRKVDSRFLDKNQNRIG